MTPDKEQTMGGEWSDEELADHISESEGDCPMCAEAARRLRTDPDEGSEPVAWRYRFGADQVWSTSQKPPETWPESIRRDCESIQPLYAPKETEAGDG